MRLLAALGNEVVEEKPEATLNLCPISVHESYGLVESKSAENIVTLGANKTAAEICDFRVRFFQLTYVGGFGVGIYICIAEILSM